jgi:hypothetical protein
MFSAAIKTAAASGGYQISRSLRFNSADSAYLNRTPASAGNRRTWTWSAWVKRGAFGAAQELFSAVGLLNDSELFGLGLNANDKISVGIQTVNVLVTTAVYRDPSAWYHIVFALDTPQATASNRAKLYVNGVQVTTFDTTNYPSQNADLGVNFTSVHGLGFLNLSGFFRYLNGYMTEVYFIDGQALTPSSFGETDAQTGVWKPKAYSGSYGTNGFYLNFSDNSNTTSTTLGKDYSGNGNNWTPNNFSVSAGAGNDSLVDTPTPYGVDTGAGGTVRGNYATLNPLNATPSPSISNGNLYQVSTVSGHMNGSSSTIGITSGKWYAEVVFTRIAGSTDSFFVGLADAAWQADRQDAGGWWGRFWYFSTGYCYSNAGDKINSNVGASYGATYTQGDVIGVAYDADAGTLVFYKNGVSQGTAYTGITGAKTIAASCYKDSSITLAFDINFGQRPFAYTAPSGFKALCTQNLPTPAVGATSTTQAGDYFNPVLYTGNGSTQTIEGFGFQPDLVWFKSRSNAYDHFLFDAVRGVGKTLTSNSTGAENNYSTYFPNFTSDGYYIGQTATSFNQIGQSFVSWGWKANGAGSSNTAGSITSTVSANTTSGFSIVTYTGNGTNGATVGHGLGVAPSFFVVKERNGSSSWVVYTAVTGNTQFLVLNNTDSAQTASTLWNNTSPTSTVFTVGTSGAVNTNTSTYVAYCFAEVPGYSRFGSYTGNGSSDGPFIFTGFRPAYVLIKCSSNSGLSWVVNDDVRNPSNVTNLSLFPDLSNAENSGGYPIDFTSNGFKIRGTGNDINANGNTYIFAAFAEFPQKYSLAR